MTMHPDQLDITVAAVRELVADQFPQWGHLDVTPVESHGTVHALVRVGPEMVARLPLEPSDPITKRAQIAAELGAAQRLLAVSPVPTPAPVALGEPGSGYPLPWALQQWLPGHSLLVADPAARSTVFATDLAGFIDAVRSMPTEGRVFTGDGRGGLLTDQDDWITHCVEQSRGLMETDALADLWERLREIPRHEPDVWTHGDLMPGNLISDGDRLTGVIDVGQLSVADPALDLQPAWNFLTAEARTAFRAALGTGDEEWQRGRGWAFAQAMGCLWYYRETNPVMSETARHTLTALLADSA